MPILFAAPIDWLSVLIPLVVTIIWVLNQVIGRLGQPQNPPRDLRRPAPPPPRPQQAKVDEEIEAFLRRAAQQRGGQPHRPVTPATPIPSPQPAPQRPLTQRSESLPSSARRKPGEGLVQVQVVDEEEGEGMRGLTVAEHVQKHLDTRSFEQRATQITKVDQADEQMEQHVHQAFDHKVGTLAAQAKHTAEAAAAAATASKITAGSVSAMLRDRNSLRNAIILQEILRRPDERW